MDKRNASSIWDQLPEDWNEKKPPASTDKPEEKQPGDSPKEDPRETPEIPVTPETPGTPEVIVPGGKTDAENPGPGQTGIIQKPEDKPGKKEERRRLREFLKKLRENRKDGPDHVKKAYEEESRKNKRDFLIVGIILAVVILAGIAAMVVFSGNSTQKIYNLVDQRNYSLAYQQIREYHDKGKNVDSAVYYFAERCVNDSEYKRAVAALEYLSPDADDADFFADLVERLVAHNKENRAREVLAFMRQHSEALRKAADELAARFGL